MISVDGSVYEGGLTDYKKHGVGWESWPDGRKYQGNYADDFMSGYG